MRKITWVLVLATVLMLAACGDSKSVSEVIDETIQTSKELESYSVEMKMDAEVMGMEMTIEGTGDVTHNPDTLYMEMEVGMTGLTMDVEAYAVDDEFYMGMFGEWFIMEEEDLGLSNFDQLNEEELEKLNNFADQFEMIEEGGKYVLTLSGEGEEFEELIESYLDAAMGDMALDSGVDEDAFENITVNSLEMKLAVDKKTMIIESQTVKTDLEVDGESYPINVEATISNVNEVDPVVIPEDVKENAALAEDMFEDAYADGYVEESLPVEEIKEMVDFSIPEVTVVPEGYELMDSVYFAEESMEMEMVYLSFGNDENEFTLYVYPSIESYGEIYEDENTENVSLNGSEAVFETIEDESYFLTWEHQNGTVLELMGEGTEFSKELMVEIGEGIE